MFLPANTFGARHESRGESLGTTVGTTLTAAAGANTKGTWVAIGASTSFAYEGLSIFFAQNSAAVDYMVDIGIGDGTNTTIIIPDLYYSARKSANEHNAQYELPVHIPAGVTIYARCAASTGASTMTMTLVGHSANLGGFPGYSRAITLFTPATSRGVTIDPGTSAHTKGSWTQLTASSSAAVAALFFAVGYAADVTRTASAGMLLDIGFGASGAEATLLGNQILSWESTYDGPLNVLGGPFAGHFPSATRFAARAQSSETVAGDRAVDLCLYGLVP